MLALDGVWIGKINDLLAGVSDGVYGKIVPGGITDPGGAPLRASPMP